ncbi:hypothetical protein CLROS_043780 [Clostridium felsineum]|uniref:Lantibiotic biosynthesis protein dehydration domain-containing protein n=2 Tax=Clostridium felsineum TaxID=36839 RepID=A0A1S8MBR9_9CLOT|nr:hypothetical protein CLROS_043780 [Clostridium felsineum]URZ09602.1 hypothetical protein CROST_002830 [Clostridium felsineum]
MSYIHKNVKRPYQVSKALYYIKVNDYYKDTIILLFNVIITSLQIKGCDAMELKSKDIVGELISKNKNRLTSISKIKSLILDNSRSIRSNLLKTERNLEIREIKYFIKEGRAIVTFTSNEKIVFQSYESKDEKIINKLIEWANKKVDKEYSLYVKKIMYSKGCSFSEYVKPVDCKNKNELFDYYFKSGELLLILYILGCEKLKSDNIIDMENNPILDRIRNVISSTNEVPNFNFSANEIAEKIVKDSVYNIEFLPESKKEVTEEEIYNIKCGFEYMYNIVMCNKLELIESLKPLLSNNILQLSTIITNVYGLNKEDLKRQLYFLDIRFSGVKISKTKINFSFSDKKETIDRSYCISMANDFGEHMIKRGIIGVKDFVTSRTWISTISDEKNQCYSLSPLGCSFMDGSSGVALFFAYLGLVTGKEYFKTVAIESIQNSVNHINNLNNNNNNVNIGAYRGIAGEIYVIWNIYKITHNMHLEDAVENGIKSLYILVQKSKEIDISNGICGALGVLIRIYKDNYISDKLHNMVLNLINLCRELVIKRINSKKLELNSVFLNDSILFILVKLLEVTGDEKLKKYIKEILSIQKLKHSDHFVKWDIRMLMSLMGRAILKNINFEYTNLDEEIEEFTKYIIKNGFGNSISYCNEIWCIDALKYTAAILKDEKIENSCIKTFNDFVWKEIRPLINKEITYANENIALLNGVVGLAYSLIRMSSEEYVPNILWLN